MGPVRNPSGKTLITVRLIVALFVATAGRVRADDVDDHLLTEMKSRGIPGLSLAVVKDGRLVKSAGYGLANIETATPAKPETVYKIASICKPILAAAVVLLAQQGKLQLDDKASKYLESAPESWRNIAIRHLLSHTSGIVRD